MFKRIMATSFIACSFIALQAGQPPLQLITPYQSPAPLPFDFKFKTDEDPTNITTRAMEILSRELLNNTDPNKPQQTMQLYTLFTAIQSQVPLNPLTMRALLAEIKGKIATARKDSEFTYKYALKRYMHNKGTDFLFSEGRLHLWAKETSDCYSLLLKINTAAARLEFLEKELLQQYH